MKKSISCMTVNVKNIRFVLECLSWLLKISSTKRFLIQRASQLMILLKILKDWFPKEEFAENFIPSFCLTVYKFQDADINETYNIHDISRMDKNNYILA